MPSPVSHTPTSSRDNNGNGFRLENDIPGGAHSTKMDRTQFRCQNLASSFFLGRVVRRADEAGLSC